VYLPLDKPEINLSQKTRLPPGSSALESRTVIHFVETLMGNLAAIRLFVRASE
jgi:hypothetical protein